MRKFGPPLDRRLPGGKRPASARRSFVYEAPSHGSSSRHGLSQPFSAARDGRLRWFVSGSSVYGGWGAAALRQVSCALLLIASGAIDAAKPRPDGYCSPARRPKAPDLKFEQPLGSDACRISSPNGALESKNCRAAYGFEIRSAVAITMRRISNPPLYGGGFNSCAGGQPRAGRFRSAPGPRRFQCTAGSSRPSRLRRGERAHAHPPPTADFGLIRNDLRLRRDKASMGPSRGWGINFFNRCEKR